MSWSIPPATRPSRGTPTWWCGTARRSPARATCSTAPGSRSGPIARASWIEPERPGGKLLLIAPPPCDAGAHAARAGLENLARTLSIEWSQYGIRTAALLPGEPTDPDEVAELVAFLASKAGDYYSGCHFRLT